MNEVERLNLQKMIQANDTEDNTPLIRDLKHSTKILEGVEVLLKLKRENTSLAKTDPKKFDSLCVEQCGFLFNHYTDIFNKVKKDEINLTILLRLLKKIYIDSALRKADKLDEANKEQEEKKPTEQISWAEFKNKKNC